MISDGNIRVDRDKCYACGICVERCIMDNLRLSVAPCRQACPLKMNCQGYVRLIALGKEKEAIEEMTPFLPFIGILGRICSHPCEPVCERHRLDGPVHIRALKRYLAETHADTCFRMPTIGEETGRTAAVVGSGPAGLMAAYELRKSGHRVTVYDAETEPGGLLRWVIPSYRLPVTAVSQLTHFLSGLGITFETGRAVGHDVPFDQLIQDYHAVVVAVGSGKSVQPEIPGCDRSGVIQALDLLYDVKGGNAPRVGRSVIVIGGGNTAVDAAITCKGLGVEDVRIVCLETPAQMPAFAKELEEATAYGVAIENCWGPSALLGCDDGGIEVEFSKCTAVYDTVGKFAPELEPVCGLRHKADSVILAVGRKLDAIPFPDGLVDSATGRFAADPLTLKSLRLEKVFFCGDCRADQMTVVHALASGKEAGLSADRFLRGERLRWGRGFWDGSRVETYEVDIEKAKGGARSKPDRVSRQAWTLDSELERPFSRQQAQAEAERCLSCGRSFEMNKTCWVCLPCEIECPVNALEVRIPYLMR